MTLLTDFYLWESHCVCRLGARTERLPSLFLSDSGIMFSRLIHLAKLNPNCHMNYSIIFTEISFSPETSILLQNEFECRVHKNSAPKKHARFDPVSSL